MTSKDMIHIKSALLLCCLTAGISLQAQVKPNGKRVGTIKTRPVLSYTVTGKVTDEATGKPVAGANITFGTLSADLTDDKGEFSIAVMEGDVDLQVAGPGYEPRTISVKGRKSVEIKLIPESGLSFQQPAVMQYDRTARRQQSASVGSFNVNGNWGRPFESVDELLQGQVAGLQSIRRSGATSKGAQLTLRGYQSLLTTQTPLIIVDGMPYDANDYGNSLMGSNVTNPLSMIHAQDIDHVTVIRDASAEYGTKGANGAIIITTSRAKRQATSIDFGVYGGYNQRPESLPMMNASQYRVYLNDMLLGRGMSSASIAQLPYMMDDSLTNPQYFRYHNNTQWQDQVLRNSLSQNYFLKVTGGDNIATYALSIGFTGMQGVLHSNDISRYNTRFNAAFNFTKKLTGQANLAFTSNEQDIHSQGIDYKISPLFLSLVKSPLLRPNEVNEKGVLSPNLEDTDVFGFSNPSVLAGRTTQGIAKNYRFTGSYRFDYEISNTLKAYAMAGVLFDKQRENLFIPRKGVADDTLDNAIAESRLGTQVRRLYSTYFDAGLAYEKVNTGSNRLTARLGQRYQVNRFEQDYTLGFNSATDELISIQNGVSALKRTGGTIQEWNWANTYFMTEYGYKDRFIVTLRAAMDASSRFGKEAAEGLSIGDVRYALMPSLGFAWIASSSPAFRSEFINLLKFRGTISRVGNDDIGNYTSRLTYGSQNLLGMQGIVRAGIPNPAIQWETGTRGNLGFDLSLWNDRISASIDAYAYRTDNMLVQQWINPASGFSHVLANNGGMRNRGIEASLQALIINRPNVKWQAGLTYAANRNRVEALGSERVIADHGGASVISIVGQPLAMYYGYRTLGVFATTAEAVASGLRTRNPDGSLSNFQGGDVKFTDLNGDRIIDAQDRQIIGSAQPKYHGGITNRIRISKFTIDALMTYVVGGDVVNMLRYQLETAAGYGNQLASVANRWRAEGQVTDMPRAAFGDPSGNARFSDRWIEDGSYLRLRALTLSYDLQFGDRFLKNATLYLTGNNLLTFTKYMGYDPEFSAGNSPALHGIDSGLDPLFRSATFGIRMGL
jgi:TonB-linked SusC/RagA family outer membrane protein